MRDHGGQKEMARFSSAERLVNLESIYKENIPQEGKLYKDIFK